MEFHHLLMVICFALRYSFLNVLIAVCMLQFILIVHTPVEGFDYFSCPNTTKFTDDSVYHLNLNRFFFGLSSGNAINSLFNNTVIDDDGPDATYGQFMCQGDLTVEACRRCVQNAPSALIQNCPTKKEAYIWYDDKCMLRYNNVSFFGTLAKDPSKLLNSQKSVSNPNSLVQVVKSVFDELINSVPDVGGPVKYFATQTIDFSSDLSSKLYHLVQCTPDLSSLNCGECLRSAFDQLQLSGFQGARVLFPSCIIRYESDQFYNITDSTVQPNSPIPHTGNGGLSAAVIVAIVVAIIVVSTVLTTVFFCLLRRKAKKRQNVLIDTAGGVDGNNISAAESLQYDLSSIKAATNNFSADNKIGEGGFGEVFKGSFNNGQQIAVKRLSKTSGQGDQEFKNEVTVVAKLQHRNLVPLLGYCLEKEERILIYEFVPNKSLDFILFDQQKKQSLDWSRRYKIIVGVARGILYLHEDSRLRIIHRDLKASNVLLDSDMNAKISDFGLARIVGVDETQVKTGRVVGTLGYMPPEYIMNGQFSVKTDVFSFGVLVLEIISGKQNNSFYRSSDHLLSHAWKLWNDGKPLELVDPCLGDSLDKNQVTRCINTGLLCVQKDLYERPTMPLVVLMLGSSSMLLPTPHRPAFFLDGKMVTVENPPDPGLFSANGVSISEFHPR